MRLWLLLRRRRRLLTLVVTSGLAFLLVSSFGFHSHATHYEAFDNSDYDLNYDSVDAVHAMVRQMSSIKRRNQLQFDEEEANPEPTSANVEPPPDTALRFKPSDSKSLEQQQQQKAKKRKIRLGIGDYPDIPDDVPKKYSFIHQAGKSTTPQSRTPPRRDPEQQLNVPDHKDALNHHDTQHQSNREDYKQDDTARNPEDDVYDEEYVDDDDEDDENDEDGENINEENVDNEEENENYNEDEYEDNGNPNPVFRQEDFDPLPANASWHKKKTFQFEELTAEDRENRLHHQEEKEEVGDYYENNDDKPEEDKDPVVEHDTRVSSRTLHSKGKVMKDGKSAERHVTSDNREALASDITRLHTPPKRQEHNVIRRKTRSRSLDRRNTGSHRSKGYSKTLHHTKVPKVDGRNSRQNIQQNVIRTQAQVNNQSDSHLAGARARVREWDVPATQIQTPRLPRQLGPVVYSNDGYAIVEDSIFWTNKVDSFIPTGLSEFDVQRFASRVKRLPVSQLKAANWNRCGRPKNQFAKLSDGTTACARYRHPQDTLLLGEVLSFYLSRMLGLDAVPSVALAQINSSSPQWRGVNITRAQWDEGIMIVMIQWLDDLQSGVKLPTIILNAYNSSSALDRHHPALLAMTPTELSELAQWSDLVLFDYITGNYDRFASMQDGADLEKKPSILAESVRNLREVSKTRKMWLIDNESGLLDSYALLYKGAQNGRRFQVFHQKMLQSFCIFRRQTVERVLELAAHSSPHELLQEYASKAEPLLGQMPKVAHHNLFKGYFHTRLKEVEAWIKQCRESQ